MKKRSYFHISIFAFQNTVSSALEIDKKQTHDCTLLINCFDIRLCKELNHIPLKCNEKKTESARLYLEEKMTEALIRKCYRCNRMFFKEEGCNKMTCVCGAQMCYICDKPVTDYKHFQGQGAGPSNL